MPMPWRTLARAIKLLLLFKLISLHVLHMTYLLFKSSALQTRLYWIYFTKILKLQGIIVVKQPVVECCLARIGGWQQYALSLQPSDYRYTFLHAKLQLPQSSIFHEKETNAWDAAKSHILNFERLKMERAEVEQAFIRRTKIRGHAAASKVFVDKKMKQLEGELEMVEQAERKRKCDLIGLCGDRDSHPPLNDALQNFEAHPSHRGVICATTASGFISQDASTIFNLAKRQGSKLCTYNQPKHVGDYHAFDSTLLCESMSPGCQQICKTPDKLYDAGNQILSQDVSKTQESSAVKEALGRTNPTASCGEGKPSGHVGSKSECVNVLTIVTTPMKLPKPNETKCARNVQPAVLTEIKRCNQARHKQRPERTNVRFCRSSKGSNIEMNLKESICEDARMNGSGTRKKDDLFCKPLHQSLDVIPEEPLSDIKELSPATYNIESRCRHASEATPSLKSRTIKKSAELFCGCHDIHISINNDGFLECVAVNTATSNLPQPAATENARKARWKDTYEVTLNGTGKKLQTFYSWHYNRGENMFGKSVRKKEHDSLTCKVKPQGQTDTPDIYQPARTCSKPKYVKFVPSRYMNAREFKKEKTKEEPPNRKGKNQHCLVKEPFKVSSSRSISESSATFGNCFLKAVKPCPSEFKQLKQNVTIDYAVSASSSDASKLEPRSIETFNEACNETTAASTDLIEAKVRKSSKAPNGLLWKTTTIDDAVSASNSYASKLEPQSMETLNEACSETMSDVEKSNTLDLRELPPSSNIASNNLAIVTVELAVPKDTNENERTLLHKTTIIVDPPATMAKREDSVSQLCVSCIQDFNAWQETSQERYDEAFSLNNNCDDLVLNPRKSGCKRVTSNSPSGSTCNINSNTHISLSTSVFENMISPTLPDREMPEKLEVISARLAAEKLIEFFHEQKNSTFIASKRNMDYSHNEANGCPSDEQRHPGSRWKRVVDSKEQSLDLSMYYLPEIIIDPEEYNVCSQVKINESRPDPVKSHTPGRDSLEPTLSSDNSDSPQNSFLREKEGQLKAIKSIEDHVRSMHVAESQTARSEQMDQMFNVGSSLLNSWDSALLSLTEQIKELDERLHCATLDIPPFGLVASDQEKLSFALLETQEMLLHNALYLTEQWVDNPEINCTFSGLCGDSEAHESFGQNGPNDSEKHLNETNLENSETRSPVIDRSHFQEWDEENSQNSMLKSQIKSSKSKHSREESCNFKTFSDSSSQVSSTSSSFKSYGRKENNAYCHDKVHFSQSNSFFNSIHSQVTPALVDVPCSKNVSQETSHESDTHFQAHLDSSVFLQSSPVNRPAMVDGDNGQFQPDIDTKERVSESEKSSEKISSYCENSVRSRISNKRGLRKLEATIKSEDLVPDKDEIFSLDQNLTRYSSDDGLLKRVGEQLSSGHLQDRIEMLSREHPFGALILIPEIPRKSSQAQSLDSCTKLESESPGKEHTVSTTSTSKLNASSHCSSVDLEEGWSISDAESLSLLSGSVDFSSWSTSELPDIFTPRERLHSYLNHTVKPVQLLCRSMQKSFIHHLGEASRAIKSKQQKVRVEIKSKKMSNSTQPLKGLKQLVIFPGANHQEKESNLLRSRIPASHLIQRGGKHLRHHKIGCTKAYWKSPHQQGLSTRNT